MKIKTLFCYAAALFVCFAAQGQVAQLQSFGQGNTLAKTYEPQFIGSDGQQAFFVQMTGRLKNKMELVSYDMEQHELARVQLSDDKEVKCYGGYLNNGGIDLLMAQWEGDNMKVYRDRRDPQSLAPRGEQLVLADYKGTSGDNMGFGMGVSANKELLACVYVIGREGQNTELQVALYSRELEEYWKVDARSNRLDFIFVSDSGEVLIGGRNGSKFDIAVLDGETENHYQFEVDETRLAEVSLVRYAGGKIYFAATHWEKEKLTMNGVMADRIVAITYDTKRREVSLDRHDITKIEYNRLNNFKDDAKVKHDDYRVIYLNIIQSMPAKDAGYVMLDQTWRVNVDGVPTTQNRLGMMVAKINDDGKFEWVQTFRISNVYAWPARMQASYRWERTDKGLLLVWSETKEKKEVPDEKPVKDYRGANGSGMLTALLLDSKGNMQRQHFEMPSRQCLLGHPYKLDNGDFLMIIRGVSRGYFAKMTLK